MWLRSIETLISILRDFDQVDDGNLHDIQIVGNTLFIDGEEKAKVERGLSTFNTVLSTDKINNNENSSKE